MTMLIATADGVQTLLESGDDDAPLIAVIPGDDVSLHRLRLLETTPAPRLEEARMRATDLAARPLEDLHVAVGPADAEGASWIAIMDRDQMAGHVAHFEAAGVKPAHILPAALLLPPEPDGPSLARFEDKVLLKSEDLAALAEPALISPLAGSSQLTRMARMSGFKPEAIPDPLPIDLLQGEFAPRHKWWKERSFRIWAGVLGALALLLLFAPLLIGAAREKAMITAHERAVIELASGTLGTRPESADAAAKALAEARRTAEGGALGARLTTITREVENLPAARIDAVELKADGQLIVQLGGPADAINMLVPRLLHGPFIAEANGPTLIMGDRRAGVAANDSELSRSMLQLLNARADAALLAAARARGAAMKPENISAAFVAAGLLPPEQAATLPPGEISVPAARSTTLLPLISDLERKGAIFQTANIRRNADETLIASLTASK